MPLKTLLSLTRTRPEPAALLAQATYELISGQEDPPPSIAWELGNALSQAATGSIGRNPFERLAHYLEVPKLDICDFCQGYQDAVEERACRLSGNVSKRVRHGVAVSSSFYRFGAAVGYQILDNRDYHLWLGEEALTPESLARACEHLGRARAEQGGVGDWADADAGSPLVALAATEVGISVNYAPLGYAERALGVLERLRQDQRITAFERGWRGKEVGDEILKPWWLAGHELAAAPPSTV
jgi:hypothetical protein